MKPDKNATRYEFGNGRFDLMTDEEVRTLTIDDIMHISMLLAEMNRLHPSESIKELAHQFYELHLRYPNSNFRLGNID